ncbi:MAG TPA: bacteriohemerythrin [Ramlibacter sp.]|uniref:bacteriohemerythrin n=1 Tax=Ramlibacter sp. TaxID=1917967 RepID=UPI002D7EDA44|nr:bacteriohemerythrin [Ramlibacter sp.]HET8748241.1 bacteriohemerythrin [Ramlibacter sp.]
MGAARGPEGRHDPPGRQGGFVVEWREAFRTGIADLDAEHQQLFALVKGLEPDKATQLLAALVEYIVTHFTHEEALMARSGYPGLRQHVEMHEALSARVSEFLVGGTGWSGERVQALRSFLNKWLVEHILTHDLAFGRWYHAAVPETEPLPLREEPEGSWFDRLRGKR